LTKENWKLGLVDGQSYYNLNLDLNRLVENGLKKQQNSNDANLNSTFMSNRDGTPFKSKILNKSHLSLAYLDDEAIDAFKKSLMNNYWELN
jgi:hypothetical protein